MLDFKDKFAHDVFYGSFINLVEGLVLFFFSILPVILHLLELFLFGDSDLVPVVVAWVNHNIWEVFEKKLPQKLYIVDFLHIAVKWHVL